MKLGKSQRDKNLIEVSSVAAFDKDGRLLFGHRADNGRWTLPGGCLNPGEDPARGAVREMIEECGLRPKDLQFLGSEMVPGKNVTVHAYKALVDGEPSSQFDPDEECNMWYFIPVDKGLPGEIAYNLHSPLNVVLKLVGLQDWNNVPDDEERNFYRNDLIEHHLDISPEEMIAEDMRHRV